MARFKDDAVQTALRQHLEPGEELKNWAYGVKQPNFWLILILYAMAILPGAIAVALLTKTAIGTSN